MLGLSSLYARWWGGLCAGIEVHMLAVNLEPGEHITDAFVAKVSLTLEIRIWSEED